MKTYRFDAAEVRKYAEILRAGDRVFLSGEIYTARDAAHKRLLAMIDAGEPAPFALRDAVIYYAGPTPGVGGRKVGSCGPTTSGRMDPFAPLLYDLGVAATIGKGERSAAVAEAIARNKAVYLCAVGGAGALISRHIADAEEIAFPDLGCESVKRLKVADMPLIVAVDCTGGDIFKQGLEAYRTSTS